MGANEEKREERERREIRESEERFLEAQCVYACTLRFEWNCSVVK